MAASAGATLALVRQDRSQRASPRGAAVEDIGPLAARSGSWWLTDRGPFQATRRIYGLRLLRDSYGGPSTIPLS